MKKWSGFLLFLCCWKAYKATNSSDRSSQYHSLTRDSCPKNYLRCEFGENILDNISDLNCFSESGLCNDIIDCSDGSDEKYCINSSKYKFNYGSTGFHFRFFQGFCLTDSIMCLSQSKGPECIPVNSICNGVKDCNDGSDERFCPYAPNIGFTYQLDRSSYRCNHRVAYGCGVPSDYGCYNVSTICDGKRDCFHRNNDEAFCPYILSSPEMRESNLSTLEITGNSVTKALSTNTTLESFIHNISLPVTHDYSPYVGKTTPISLPTYSLPFDMETNASSIIKVTPESSIYNVILSESHNSSLSLGDTTVSSIIQEQEITPETFITNIMLPEPHVSSPFVVASTESSVTEAQTRTTPNSSLILIQSPENNLSQIEDVTISTTSINNVTSPPNQETKPPTLFNDSPWHYLLIFAVIVVIINTILIIIIFITLVRFYRYINSPTQKYRPSHALQDPYIWDDL